MYLKDGKKARGLMYKHLHTKVEIMQLKMGERKKDRSKILKTSQYNIIQKVKCYERVDSKHIQPYQ